MKRGRAKLVSEKQTVFVREGDIFFIPNGCRYHSFWYGETTVEFISLGFGFMPNFEGRYYPTQVIKASREAIELINEIGKDSSPNCVTVGKFYTLAGMLMQNMSFAYKNPKTELIDKVKALIAEDPTLSVKDIARRCAVSESSLYSTFMKYSNKSIHEIKTDVIMQLGKAMLISSDRTVEQISDILNFSSAAYFRKCFREHYGCSPREMRKSGAI